MTQLALEFGHRTALDADDFLVTPANHEAVLWLDRWPNWPGPALALYGPPGCGKSHLAHVWRARSGARLLAAADLDGARPDDLLGGGRCAVIEGAGEMAFDERAFFHLYNVVNELGGHLLITGRRPPARWAIALADLRSRLNAVPAVAVREPDDVLIAALLVKLFADRQLRVGEEVIAFLVARMERSFAAAQRTVAALDAAALADRRNITVPLARRILTRQTDEAHQTDEDREEEPTWTSD